ncbi:accessory Sec system S-layer assembly protein [Cytobacillus firmus]|uniref:accessory Sec system S-layer assembly protein n=1 Tax=Cytobacillus firmus TaxID=1399 RepID=UPI002187CE82|nr:accessory Sec system S-layer assembly protein [Cytobacillus firmus]URM33419.1 accessory Sec system S-layer assembly protein [Cytobacillus firmus]
MGIFQKRKKSAEAESPALQRTEEKPKMTLYFHPDMVLTSQEKYIFQFYHQKLPELKPNQLSISGVKLEEYNDSLVVTAFLRNSLNKPVKFDKLDLLLLDRKNQPFAKKTFDMYELVEVPAMTSVPWKFFFENEARITDAVPSNDEWRIAFELKQEKKGPAKPRLELEDSWEKQLSPEKKKELEDMIRNLPHLSPGEVNFMGLEAKFTEERSLAVSVLIRNGSEKNISFEQLPLIVEDAQGDVISKGGFKLTDFEVKAGTCKPWTFIFPSDLILKETPDLSTWKIYPPKS